MKHLRILTNLRITLNHFLRKHIVTTRYFIVFYRARFEGQLSLSEGQINMDVKGDNPFLNRNKCFDVIKQHNPKVMDLIITNFIEVSESEYKTWTL